MLRVSASLLALLTVVSSGCKKKPPLRAEGVVVDAVSGKPMPGILVSSFQIGGGDTASDTTDGNGHFSVRGKFDADRPYQLKAEAKDIVMTMMAPSPRLPYTQPVRIEVLRNDLPDGFNVPSGGASVKAPVIDAKVTLPPADHPTAPLAETIDGKDIPASVPSVVIGDQPVSVVLAPPTEHCECAVQKLIQQAGSPDWHTDGEMVRLDTWQPQPGTIMPTVMMHVLVIPPGKLTPGRWVFWPTTPPAYDVMVRMEPKVFRQGYIFDVSAK